MNLIDRTVSVIKTMCSVTEKNVHNSSFIMDEYLISLLVIDCDT
jgi:hypothetical protein